VSDSIVIFAGAGASKAVSNAYPATVDFYKGLRKVRIPAMPGHHSGPSRATIPEHA